MANRSRGERQPNSKLPSIYEEVGLTVEVHPDSREFVKIIVGQERYYENDPSAVEAELFADLAKTALKRIKQLKKIAIRARSF